MLFETDEFQLSKLKCTRLRRLVADAFRRQLAMRDIYPPQSIASNAVSIGLVRKNVLAFVLDYRCDPSKVVASAEICVVRYRLGRVR